jgi:hypothetical protein
MLKIMPEGPSHVPYLPLSILISLQTQASVT